MSKILLRREALQLRLQGQSYSQIKQKLGVSKSTLSIWLKDYPLSKTQIVQLRDKNEGRIEKYRQTMRKKRESRLSQLYKREKDKWLPLSSRELLIAGLFLYWGEGHKANNHSTGITNSDPLLIQFALHWLTKCLNIPPQDIHVYLHLYSDMDIDREIDFWSKKLNLPKAQFAKPYIKKSTRLSLDHKGHGHGTCSIVTYGVSTKESILMALKAIAEYYVDTKI